MAISFVPAETVKDALCSKEGVYCSDKVTIILKKYQNYLPLPFQFIFRLNPYGDKKLTLREEKALAELAVWLELHTEELALHQFANELKKICEKAKVKQRGIVALGD